MAKINWDDYKEHKKHSSKENNFDILLEFIKSFYNMTSPIEIFNMLNADDISKMMLDKRSINDAEAMENYLFNI